MSQQCRVTLYLAELECRRALDPGLSRSISFVRPPACTLACLPACQLACLLAWSFICSLILLSVLPSVGATTSRFGRESNSARRADGGRGSADDELSWQLLRMLSPCCRRHHHRHRRGRPAESGLVATADREPLPVVVVVVVVKVDVYRKALLDQAATDRPTVSLLGCATTSVEPVNELMSSRKAFWTRNESERQTEAPRARCCCRE